MLPLSTFILAFTHWHWTAPQRCSATGALGLPWPWRDARRGRVML